MSSSSNLAPQANRGSDGPQPAQARPNSDPSPPSPTRVFFREFIVDLLGSLVPGYVFTVAATLALLVPIFALARHASGMTNADPILSTNIKDALTTFRIEILASLLIISYIIGCLLYRQTPKTPDEKSWACIKKEEPDFGPVGENQPVEFPYYFLYEYLSQRGLKHLATLVPWRGNNKETHPLRTKHFINILKTRIEFSYPERYSPIARNEGHVRLMSSGWYCNRALKIVSILGLLVGFTVIVLASIKDGHVWPCSYLWAIFGPVVVLVSAVYGNIYIERAFHYVRRREVISVLETTYWVSKHDPKILQDLQLGEELPNQITIQVKRP